MNCDRYPQRLLALAALGLVAGVSGGCSILNPYEGEFLCEGKAGFGRCASVAEAYQESIDTPISGGHIAASPSPSMSAMPSVDERSALTSGSSMATDTLPTTLASGATAAEAESLYRRAVHTKMAALLSAPTTPLSTQAREIRVLLLPYTDVVEGQPALFMARHIYLRVADPEWVLGNYLTTPDEAGRAVRP